MGRGGRSGAMRKGWSKEEGVEQGGRGGARR